MTRNLKALGLALVAAMALGVIGAQGASAAVEHTFKSGSADTVLTGQNESYSTGGSKHIFTATPGLTVECDATFSWTNLDEERDTVTVRPTYSSCGGEVTVTNSGCLYEFDSDTTQASGHSTSSEHASVNLNCAHQHHIQINRPGCNITFEDTHTSSSTTVNQSLHGVRYTQLSSHSGKHALTVNATVKTIKYTVLSGSFCGLAGHPAGTYSSGEYAGTASVTGFVASTGSNDATNGTTWTHGAQVDLTISGTP